MVANGLLKLNLNTRYSNYYFYYFFVVFPLSYIFCSIPVILSLLRVNINYWKVITGNLQNDDNFVACPQSFHCVNIILSSGANLVLSSLSSLPPTPGTE